MSKKTFAFVQSIVNGVAIIAMGAVTYLVEDNATAAAIVVSIGIAEDAIVRICEQFVKDEPKKKE